jgi:hypothetical protein
MLREARTRKVHDWLVGYVVMKGPHAEDLRVAWVDDVSVAKQFVSLPNRCQQRATSLSVVAASLASNTARM